MKSTRNFTLLKLAMALPLAIGFNAGFANAQTVVGKFTLPFEAHWGHATLPAGDYSFMLERGPDAKLLVSRGNKNVAYIVAQGYTAEPPVGASMTVVQNSAGNTVRELSLPGIGKTLRYAPNKPGRAAEERLSAQLIPVTTAGK